MRPWFALSLLVLPLLGCGAAADGAILVTVRGVDEQVRELRTIATLDGLRLAGGERVPKERFLRDGDSVRFRLAPPPGRGGDLVLSIEALLDNGAADPALAEEGGAGCFVAAGRSTALPLASGDALEVRLAPLAVPKCCDAGWLCWEGPPTHGINALWSRGEEVFAVGDRGTLLHSTDGTSFRREPSGTRANLVGLFRGGSDLWIIGAKERSGVLLRSSAQGVTEQMAFPVPLAAISGWEGELWVGGANQLWRLDGQGRPLGGGPMQLGADLTITALWGRSPTDAWLVGYDGAGAVIRRYDGAWSANLAPAGFLGAGHRASAVYGSGADLWVLGHEMGQLLLGHYDGATWRVSGSGAAAYAPEEDRFGLWASGPGDLWLAHGALLGLATWPVMADWQRAAQTWRTQPDAAPEPWVRAVHSSGVGSTLWAAGSGGRIWRLARDSGVWTQVHPAPGTVLDTLSGISIPLRGLPLLAGSGGLYEVGGEVPMRRLRQGSFYRVVAGDEAGDEIVALQQGSVLRGSQQVAEGAQLVGLWVHKDEIWAVGDRIVHVRGTTRLPDEAPPAGCNVQELRDIWGDRQGALWAVGRAACILHRSIDGDGAGAWIGDHVDQAGLDLRGVFGNAAGEVWAVGEGSDGGGLILRRDPAGRWSTERARLPYPLYGVWAGDDEAWAMGQRGELLHRQRGEWTVAPLSRHLGLSDGIYYPIDLFGLQSDDVWFIAKHGTLLRYRPPGP